VTRQNLLSIVCCGNVAVDPSDAQLEGWLATDLDQDAAGGATGALLICDGEFMQCIEGTEQQVAFALDRLFASPGLCDMFEMMNEPIEQRSLDKMHLGVAAGCNSRRIEASTARWEKQYLWAQGWKLPRSLELLRLFWSRGSCSAGAALPEIAVAAGRLVSPRPAPLLAHR
jgi:Sensors of blue-light using FAD